jgi:hypothetical protein
MSEKRVQLHQSSDFPTTGYEGAEEERQALREEGEGHDASVAEGRMEEVEGGESPTNAAAPQEKRS